ncbi:aryl-sulfate sulfohydrolase, partial [Rhodopirellula sp. ICT_H3.1]|nr:aryl-sulfate sulfohydrolase [Aporhodopirellula aestuarii]
LVDGYAATAASLANLDTKPGDLDGVNLIPFLSGDNKAAPHDTLTWRWIAQAAIREGDWKLLRGGEREYLYNLKTDIEEKHNLLKEYPEVADRLRRNLTQWSQTLDPPGLATAPMAPTWMNYYDFYLEGLEPAQTRDELSLGIDSTPPRKNRRNSTRRKSTASE